MTHVKHNSGKIEWYTPPHVIVAAKEVMGSIDLDPASSAVANKIVGANSYFSKENNGLFTNWCGNIWLNPPYQTSLITPFVEKTIQEIQNGNVEQICFLSNNATDTLWFQKIIPYFDAICFFKGRLKFYNEQLQPLRKPLQGQILGYYSKNKKYIENFYNVFKKMGIVLRNFYL